MNHSSIYAAIDLKSFYASVECVERGLDPLDTCLVVADAARTDKTICLAVTPPLKAWGVPGRPRLFQVIRQVGELNTLRRSLAPGHRFTGSSYLASRLRLDPSLELDYITAVPRMTLYMDYSTRIVNLYRQYVADQDIHVYSVDEVLIDLTPYRRTYGVPLRELLERMVHRVWQETGITATVGVGTNLYLCKVAMDIVAKHLPGDSHGMRLAYLDELDYRKTLWDHRPLTDFWQVGPATMAKLAGHGLYTMGDVARMSLVNEDALYKQFGVNAELLIDHAWGWESCTLADIKKYVPKSHSLGSGQVLPKPYPADRVRLIVWEMADLLALDLVKKGLVTRQIVLHIGYDRSALEKSPLTAGYTGPLGLDGLGRLVPSPSHGSRNLPDWTASSRLITLAAVELYDAIIHWQLPVRKVSITASYVQPRSALQARPQEGSLFGEEPRYKDDTRELAVQETVLGIQARYGRNALLKGSNLEEGAMTRTRNTQVGGHRA